MGAFAVAPIRAHQKVGELHGATLPAAQGRRQVIGARRIMLVELSPTEAIDLRNSPDPLKYLNHSCAPNALLRVENGVASVYSLRDIEAGEELCADYGLSHHAGTLRCRCGATDCRGWL